MLMSNDPRTFIEMHATPYAPASDTSRRPPFAAPVKAGKNTPIYNAHSYHTKVPPQGIVPYVLHYADPGDLILDPFCGSGMTSVAALMCAHPPPGRAAAPGPRHPTRPALYHPQRPFPRRDTHRHQLLHPCRRGCAAAGVRAHQSGGEGGVRLALHHHLRPLRRPGDHPVYHLERCLRVRPLRGGTGTMERGSES